MKVSTVLESLPGVGKVRAQKIMEELDISATRRVRGLGSKQRELLLEQVRQEVASGRVRRGTLIVVAGPSGVGKGSVVRRLLARDPEGLALSVSATTRPPATGRDSTAWTTRSWARTRFDAMIADRRAAGVGRDRRASVRDAAPVRRGATLDAGRDVILEIDVQGAATGSRCRCRTRS